MFSIHVLIVILLGGRGNINAPLVHSSTDVHACFADHVFNGFYTSQKNEIAEEKTCYDTCPRAISPAQVLTIHSSFNDVRVNAPLLYFHISQ